MPAGTSEMNTIMAKPMLSDQNIRASSFSHQACRADSSRRQNSRKPMSSMP